MHQKVLWENKIPSLKHQFPNKSQISIFNDQNISRSYNRLPCSFCLPMTSKWYTFVDGSKVWNFEFGSLRVVWDLIFGAWDFCEVKQVVVFIKAAQSIAERAVLPKCGLSLDSKKSFFYKHLFYLKLWHFLDLHRGTAPEIGCG